MLGKTQFIKSIQCGPKWTKLVHLLVLLYGCYSRCCCQIGPASDIFWRRCWWGWQLEPQMTICNGHQQAAWPMPLVTMKCQQLREIYTMFKNKNRGHHLGTHPQTHTQSNVACKIMASWRDAHWIKCLGTTPFWKGSVDAHGFAQLSKNYPLKTHDH